jgi:hypothetical protein
VESSLQWRDEVSIWSLGRSKANRQGTSTELTTTGTVSLPVWAPTRFPLGNPRRCLKPLAHRQAHRGDEGAHSEHHRRNPCRGRCNPRRDGRIDQERHNLSLEGPGPKALGSNVRNMCFPKCF